jgi:hypothetical protein
MDYISHIQTAQIQWSFQILDVVKHTKMKKGVITIHVTGSIHAQLHSHFSKNGRKVQDTYR